MEKDMCSTIGLCHLAQLYHLKNGDSNSIMSHVLPRSTVLCRALYMHGIIYCSQHLYVIVCFTARKVKFRESKQLASICSDEVFLCVISNLSNISLLYN